MQLFATDTLKSKIFSALSGRPEVFHPEVCTICFHSPAHLGTFRAHRSAGWKDKRLQGIAFLPVLLRFWHPVARAADLGGLREQVGETHKEPCPVISLALGRITLSWRRG